jgi:hypothetical protein
MAQTMAPVKTIKDFNAVFTVEAMGMVLGKVRQTWRCLQAQCILSSTAKPEGIAALFTSDYSIETVYLEPQEENLEWLKYHKLGVTYKNGVAIKKNETLIRDNNKITYVEKQKSWPAQHKVFDSISIAYAVQTALMNSQPINGFFVQDTQFQDKLNLTNKTYQELDLGFTSEPVDAIKLSFDNQHSEIELWLLNQEDYFPGKIRVKNYNNKTITLTLAEQPKYNEIK